MPTFMTSFVYESESWRKLAKHPEDRSVPIKALLDKLGGRLIGLYYMAGDYDGFVIYEAPDAKAAATLAIVAGMAGHIRGVKTSQLFTVGETMEFLGQAGTIAFPTPKG